MRLHRLLSELCTVALASALFGCSSSGDSSSAGSAANVGGGGAAGGEHAGGAAAITLGGNAGASAFGGAAGSTSAGGRDNAGSAGTTTGNAGASAGGATSTGGAVSTGGTGAGAGGAAMGGTSSGGTTATCPVVGATTTALPALTVQLDNQYRAVSHAASGSLYGLASDGTPPDALIAPTKPFMFTQMPPNGQQLGNGATTPSGDVLKVAAAAARAGARVTIRMPDIYPNFPYQWVSFADWYSKVDAIVTATQNAKLTNLYAYELWNEPNWTWNNPNDTGSPFNEGWKNTYQRIKAKDTSTKIMGPSISIWDQGFMQSFLSYCKTNDCLPDIVSWHELGDVNGVARPGYIPTSVAAYRALEASLGISKRPISINEYGVVAEEGVPGSLIRYVAQFERQGVESACIAYWHRSGQLSDLLTSGHVANGGWWLFKFYGDMSGSMAMTVPAATGATVLALDGIASVDATAKNVQVVFGGASGDNAVVLQGFASAPFFGCQAHVKAESTPWNGVNSAVAAPTSLFEGDYPINDGKVIVPIKGMVVTSGYRLTITPS